MKTYQQRKVQETDDSTGGLWQIFVEELTPSISKLHKKNNSRGRNSFILFPWGQYYRDMKAKDIMRKKTIHQYPLWIMMQKSSAKYQQTEFKSLMGFHWDRKKINGCQQEQEGRRNGAWVLNVYRVSFYRDENVLELDSGNNCTTL